MGSLTIEAVGAYVRVTVENMGGIGTKPIVEMTRRECPDGVEVVELVARLRRMPSVGMLDRATWQACGWAADDARRNRAAAACGVK